MLIHIVGAGVIGKATGEGFRRFGHDVIYTDKEHFGSHPGADIHFVCTPEQAVPKVVSELAGSHEGDAVIVIRSTTPPGTIRDLSTDLHCTLWHNPEFLRSATAGDDFLHCKYTLIGRSPTPMSDDWPMPPPDLFPGYDLTYGRMGVEPILCSSTQSELVKLITNAKLANEISFWNDMQGLCEMFEENSHMIARLVTLDGRISHYGAFKHGAPYGGSCLPKDVQQLLDVYQSKMVGATQEINQRIGGA